MKADERLRRHSGYHDHGLGGGRRERRPLHRGRAEDYLPKPFDPILLRARINAWLAQASTGATASRSHLRRYRGTRLRPSSSGCCSPILPGQVIGRLNRGETMIADRFGAA